MAACTSMHTKRGILGGKKRLMADNVLRLVGQDVGRLSAGDAAEVGLVSQLPAYTTLMIRYAEITHVTHPTLEKPVRNCAKSSPAPCCAVSMHFLHTTRAFLSLRFPLQILCWLRLNTTRDSHKHSQPGLHVKHVDKLTNILSSSTTPQSK